MNMYTCWEIQGCGILIVLVTIYSASQKSLNLTREYALVALWTTREWQFCLDALYTRKHTLRGLRVCPRLLDTRVSARSLAH